ncbi:tRNA-uridine aminocarboxypropyltransferase 1 isoform X2 [Polypterus senegalus]|uniref:tRNA-uridine aminocarboxypropyltransferase 1 isoform X2 n=1 Tax=Polypterus senegalus TaxID=55291 RepID=UPI00196651B7|nr:tRNA-uridine aminocarboxypropyltransferase 1 isoform X2 [Polypterus senegalus]
MTKQSERKSVLEIILPSAMSSNSDSTITQSKGLQTQTPSSLQLSICHSPSKVKNDETTKDQHELPLQNLKLASHEVLERAQQAGRSKCSKCSSSRMFYCYSCFTFVGVSEQEIPNIKLPLKIDIIKHPNETDGKSTAVHAKLLAPDDVNIFIYPCIPDYEGQTHEVVLVFPGPEAVTVEDIVNRLPKAAKPKSSLHEPIPKRVKLEKRERGIRSMDEDVTEKKGNKHVLKRVVFIDSTWNQTSKIITDERLQALLQVELKTRKSCFWRHQKGSPDTYLSTIEAIYYFLMDYHLYCLEEDYQGEYDNLLFFYSFMFRLITKAKYAAGKL